MHYTHALYILCTWSHENNAFSVLHYVIKVTLNYLMFHRFEIHSSLELSRMAFLMSSRGCSLAIRSLRFVWENRSRHPVAPVQNETDKIKLTS